MNKNCDLLVVDASPRANPPYCMRFGEDFCCDGCLVDEIEKESILKEYDRRDEILRTCKRRRKNNANLL